MGNGGFSKVSFIDVSVVMATDKSRSNKVGIFEPKISELTPGGSGRKDETLATQVRKVAPRRSRDAKTTPRTLRIACACLWQSQSAKIVEMVEVFAPPLRVRMLIPVSGLAADAALCAARLKTPAINRRNVVLSLPRVNESGAFKCLNVIESVLRARVLCPSFRDHTSNISIIHREYLNSFGTSQ